MQKQRGGSNDRTRSWGGRCGGPARPRRPRRIGHRARAAGAGAPMLPTRMGRRTVLGTLGCNGMVEGRGRSPWTFSLHHVAFASASTAAAASTREAAAGASSTPLAALDPGRLRPSPSTRRPSPPPPPPPRPVRERWRPTHHPCRSPP
jgi:hypothetical protein